MPHHLNRGYLGIVMKNDRIILFVKGLILLGLLASLWACGSEQESYLPAPYVENKALLDSAFNLPEINLRFFPPSGWAESDSSAVSRFAEMLSKTALSKEFYTISPRVIFRDSATGAITYVALIIGSTGDFEQFDRKFTDFMVKNQGTAGMETKNYQVNGLKIKQLIMHNPEMVNYKILGEVDPNNRFLIEYIIGARYFGDLEPSISASLAELAPLTIAVPPQDK